MNSLILCTAVTLNIFSAQPEIRWWAPFQSIRKSN
jgi:hypothetical protein